VRVATVENDLWIAAMRTFLRQMGFTGWFDRPTAQVFKSVAHELDLSLPDSHDAAMRRVERTLASLSWIYARPLRSESGTRVRGVVASDAKGGLPIVVTVDFDRNRAGGTQLTLRFATKALFAGRRIVERAAQSVAARLTQPATTDSDRGYAWFEIDPIDAAEMSPAEIAFAAALRAHSAAWTPTNVDGDIGAFGGDGVTDPVIAYATLTDPADKDRYLASVGVHVLGERVRGDRLHSQLETLPDRPSSWALDTVGTRDQLAEASAQWFRQVLDKPIVLYVWLHKDSAYAARYAFADTGETLTQFYTRTLAPAGQAEELIAAGHVHGRGWIQTVGLPAPSCYLHIRGDLGKGTVPFAVPEATHRGPLGGLWYEGQ